jgi:hypothetical protein
MPRYCPNARAIDFVNEKRQGVDRKWWKAIIDKNGVYRWVRTSRKPSTQKPSIQKPPAQKPSAQKPSTQKPAAQKPAAQKPSTQKPSTQKPSTQKPSTQKLSSRKSMTKTIWEMIDSLDWSRDHDMARCRRILKTYSKPDQERLSEFVFERVEELMKKFKHAESNVLSEVVSKGETMFDSVTAASLRKVKDPKISFEDLFEEDW